MKIIEPSVELLFQETQDRVLERIETAGRTCYKSEEKMGEGTAEKFARNIIKRGHGAVLEHATLTFRIICDRGVSHELVRHRMAAYCQESTRYCNYSRDGFGSETTVVKPNEFHPGTELYTMWKDECEQAEATYMEMIKKGSSPQNARSVLPNSLKTEVVMTANIIEWRHFLKLRLAPGAHPDMIAVARLVYDTLVDKYPVLFEDVWTEKSE